MKTTTKIFPAFIVLASLLASASPIELVIHGAADSAAPIVVEEMPKDNLELPSKWTFSAPATGWTPRTVLRIQATIYHLPFTNSFVAYLDTDSSGSYTPGEPFGVSNLRGTPEIELTDMSAITPRLNLWNNDVGTASDRGVVAGPGEVTDGKTTFDPVTPAGKTLVTVSRYRVDGHALLELGKGDNRKVLSKTFESKSRDYLHEGDFLADGKLDIDWDHLYGDIVSSEGALSYGGFITNVSYLVTFNWDPNDYLERNVGSNTPVRANTTLVTRRFEHTRTVPTPALASSLASGTTTFSFRIDNEDKWASWFGTTYTAFKVKVMSGSTEVWNSGILRLPPRDQNGVYTANFSNLSNLSNLSWRVALYNAKFKTDTLMYVDYWGLHEGDPFSPPEPITVIGD